MTEDRAPYAVPPRPCPADAEWRMWLMIRRGLLLVVKAAVATATGPEAARRVTLSPELAATVLGMGR